MQSDRNTKPLDPQLTADLSTWRCEGSGPFFPLIESPAALMAQAVPAESVAALIEYGGREGFLGQCYLRLYRYAELLPLNEAFAVPLHAPEVFIFGSDGAEEAYAFGIGTGEVFMVPLIPLGMEHAQLVGNDFKHFIRRLAESGSPLDLNQIGRAHV